MLRTYEELITFKSFEERFNYLSLNGVVGYETFGGHRLLNQMLYSSPQWKRVRQQVIIRDNGCDLGIDDRPISYPNQILIHHMNPITIEQVSNHDPCVFDLNNLISVSKRTHNAIHYGDEGILVPSKPIERKEGDTKLW